MSKSGLEQYVLKAWYGRPGWLWLLLPFNLLFILVSAIRRWAFSAGIFKSHRVNAPVIVVGNVTVGGTGKSPVTSRLAILLRENGYHPGVVSRGYGINADHSKKQDETIRLVNEASSADEVGDEPLMLFLQTGVPVAVASERWRAAQSLIAEKGCDVILCDDGLQHYALQRDIEICVIDSRRLMGNGFRLPLGPLREPLKRIRRVHWIVANGDLPEKDKAQLERLNPHVVEMQLQPQALRNIQTMALDQDQGQDQSGAANGIEIAPKIELQLKAELENWRGKPVHAVAGIGHPQRFFDLLRSRGLEVIEHAFPDHYSYQLKDVDFKDDLPVVMTEKDAVKCRQLVDQSASSLLGKLWYLPVSSVMGEQFEIEFLKQIEAL